MQDFDNIQSLWQSHSVEVKISSEQMLEQVKKEVNAIRSRSMINIIGMIMSFVAISLTLFFSELEAWTTTLGISIIILAIAIYTILLSREHHLLSRNDFTEHPEKFLTRLHAYQLSRFNLYHKLYWFYAAAISAGFILFFFEALQNFETWVQVSVVLFTALWIVFCATTLRRAFMSREKERIDLLIEKFERLSKQFTEKGSPIL